MNRAFHIAGIVWCGLCLILPGTFSSLWLPCVAALLWVCMLLRGRKQLPLWVFSAVAAVCFCSSFLIYEHSGRLELMERYKGTVQTLRGLVTDRTNRGSSRIVTLRLEDSGSPPGMGGKYIRVISPASAGMDVGDVVEAALRLDCDASKEKALFSQGVLFEAFLYTEPKRVERRQNDLTVKLFEYREKIGLQLTKMLPLGEGALLAAMLTGRAGDVDSALRDIYARAGIAHLLAVSGLHLAILVGLLDALLGCTFLSRKQKLALEIGAVLGFMALTGFSHSVVRAGIMVILCKGAMVLGRDSDTLNSLGISVIIILLTNPYAIYSTGLQLSYLATMGIAAYCEPLCEAFCGRVLRREWSIVREERPVVSAVLSCFAVTLSAQILTVPVVCWQFGTLSLVSPVVNLLISPPAASALLFGMCSVITGFISLLNPFSRLFGWLAGVSLRFIEAVSRSFAALPFAALSVKETDVFIWIVAVVLLFVSLWPGRARGRLLLWMGELAACSLVAVCLSRTLLWGRPLTLAVPAYGESVALVYGEQAAVVGAPGSALEAEHLIALFRESKVTSLCVLIPEKKNQLSTEAVRVLTEAYRPERVLSLEESPSFEVRLFGGTRLSANAGGDGEQAEKNGLQIEAGGYTIVKDFDMNQARAHLLVNGRNEIIAAPGLTLPINNRYDGASVIRLQIPRLTGDKMENGAMETGVQCIMQIDPFPSGGNQPLGMAVFGKD